MIVVEVEVVVGEGEVEVEMQGRLMTIQRGVEMSQIRLFFWLVLPSLTFILFFSYFFTLLLLPCLSSHLLLEM